MRELKQPYLFVNTCKNKNRYGFTLIELLVVIAIIGLLASVVLVSMQGVRLKARDARRQQDLSQIKLAIELSYNKTGSYVTGTFFSGWDMNTWGHPFDPNKMAFYNALVGNGYLAKLPYDPVNQESEPGNSLEDGPPNDQAYIYWSDNGQRYVLGTNLESIVGPTNWLGNYQIKGGSW